MSSENRIKRTKINLDKRTNVNWPLIGLIIIYIAALLISGFDQFIKAGFDFSIVGTEDWWYKVFQSIAINNLILLGTLLYLLDKMRKNDKDILDWIIKIDKAVNEQVDPNTFDPWLILFNTKRKIKLFKNAIMLKIDKIDNKVKAKSLDKWLKYNKLVSDELLKDEAERVKIKVPKNRYCKNKYNLLAQTKEEYLNDRIAYLRIGYKDIQKSFITNGYISRKGGNDPYHIENGWGKMFRDLAPRVIITIAYLLAFNTIVLDVLDSPDWKVAVVAIALKLLPMIMQVFVATSYAKQFKIEKILVDFRTRYEMITLYVASLHKPKVLKEV